MMIGTVNRVAKLIRQEIWIYQTAKEMENTKGSSDAPDTFGEETRRLREEVREILGENA